MHERRSGPKARQHKLLVEPLDEELLVFDEERMRAHSLNHVAADVWRACDGKRDTAELAMHCGLDEQTVALALDRLRVSHLLEVSDAVFSRRAILRRSAVAGAGLGVAIPIVRSITAPSAAFATSTHKGKATQKCTKSADCSTSSMCDMPSGICHRKAFASCSHDSSCHVSACLASPMNSAKKICCFTFETEVLMAGGARRPIGLLKPGEMVMARDERTGSNGARPVEKVFRHDVEELLLLHLANGSQIKTTRSHPFAAPDGRFRSAGTLQPGDALAGRAGSSILRSAEPTDGRFEVFNLRVDGYHTYFIGEDAVWVHNK